MGMLTPNNLNMNIHFEYLLKLISIAIRGKELIIHVRT
jgi:hypothetical protein